ncbi:hypothetical protein [Bosea sp. (in: a-proteobacteria)]|uniref:hypothetical protein n=1 Tax=Bosea sp. (in: a-proteobacteria) TaxID=1871050 RepID=UPI002FC8A723
MLRKLLLGVSAAAALGVAAIASTVPTPAVAQPYGDGYGYSGPRWGGGYGYGRPYYGYGRPGYGYGRPDYGPRCFYRPVRYWDGWGWVVRERRICR